MGEVTYLHFHYDYDNNVETTCRDMKCYNKMMKDKAILQAYQDQLDRDLQMKDDLQHINEMIQDPRIDDYR